MRLLRRRYANCETVVIQAAMIRESGVLRAEGWSLVGGLVIWEVLRGVEGSAVIRRC